MNVFRHDQSDFESALARACAASSLFDPGIDARVRGVIADVQARGDAALLELTERFDQVKLTAAGLRVTGPAPRVPAALGRAIALAHRNVAAFARRSRRESWQMRNAQGATVGEKYEGFQRVGIYIPGGTAPLVSTVLMTVTLAKAAGCREIVVCSPPPINPSLLCAALKAGATEIYQLGGSQAIAALALGTNTIQRVQKVFGPGNAYVVAAKRLLFGYVAIDLLPGPSEVLIIADDSANPAFIAADMLAQAEHGSGHERVWLVTTSERVLDGTQLEIDRQLPNCRRREFIEKALVHSGVSVLVKDLQQAVSVANRFAPEHCELMTRKNAALVKQIKTAGAIFIGACSPTVTGDYVAGPSHTLPTGGAGRSFPGLTVDQFQRRTSVVEYTSRSLAKSLPAIEKFAEVEGLDAHAASGPDSSPPMSYIRDNIERMSGYLPGEQPKVAGLIKLNTNENPYPPSPKVFEALHAAIDGRLRLYPDPSASGLRQKLGEIHGFAADQIVIGNGGDDILNLCVRAFCGPGEKLAYFSPSYSLYPVLSNIQDAAQIELPLDEHFQITVHPPLLAKLDSVKLVFITQPNAPSGVWLQRVELQRVIEETQGVVVIDEAYVDFASDNCLDFARDYPNVLVVRTFSKSFSLAGLRIGWAVGARSLIAALDKVKDSYNVNRLSQVAAEAAVEDWPYFEQITQRVKTTRERTAAELMKLGFFVYPSQTNFIFARPPTPVTAKQWFDGLREKKVLVRWWNADRIRDYARVSIGTDEEMDQFLQATKEICEKEKR